MRWMLAVPVLTLALASTSALAQAVYKCTDANGRTTYTNTPCAHNKLEGQVLMRERSLSERIEERMQYREALEAKHERQRAEAERQAMLEQERYQRRAMARSMEAAARASAPPKKNSGSVSIFAKPQTRAQRGLPPAPQSAPQPAPSIITHCAGGFCYDNQGGTYHSHGNGVTSTGPSGGTCVQTGATLQCY